MFFFNFDDSESATNVVTESLVSDGLVYTANLDNVRVLLERETEKQGLRNSDLAELTGWSPSKTSKLAAGRQKLTPEDIRTWSRALGYTPDPFINGKVDIRYYKLSEYIRKPSDVLEAYFNALEGMPDCTAIARYELPLSILTAIIGAPVFISLLSKNRSNLR